MALPEVVAFDLSIAAQVFGHRDEHERYAFTVCAEVPGPVMSTTGFTISAPSGLEALGEADTVIVPGYFPLSDPSPAVQAALRSAAERGVRIASICIGAFALAATGLLDGRTATTHWQESGAFRARFPAVRLNPDVLYVDEGQFLTSAGLSAGIDLCLYLVGQDYGAGTAAGVARRMVVAMHRPGGQAQYAQHPLPEDAGSLGPTLDWAVTEMGRPLTVGHLARHAGMPPRTFARQFREQFHMTPMRWLTGQRLLEARRLLEVTGLSVDDVAERCGLGSAATLRVHLARELGTTPTEYRRSHASTRVAELRRLVAALPLAAGWPGTDSGDMSNFDELLQNNARFAQTDAKDRVPEIPFIPNKQVYILTCIDPRVDPVQLFGLELGDAIVARTVGGRVTPAVIQDLAWISYLHETKTPDANWFEFAVMHHTECGSGFFADDELRHGFAARGGYDDAELAKLAVLDPTKTVPGDVEKIISAPQVSGKIKVSGFAYDVKTGLVTTVVPPRSREAR